MIIIFDLDGTVLDTYPLIRQNFMEIFTRFLPEYHYTEEELQSYFGPPLIDTFMKLTNNEEMSRMLIREYRKVSDRNNAIYTRLFPNTVFALDSFQKQGIKMVVLSNKRHEAIILGLKTMEIDEYFSVIIGHDDVLNPKPHPEGIYKIMTILHDEKAVMIGDTETDIRTAQNAGIPAIGCTWAITKESVFKKAKANRIVNDYMKFIQLMEEYNV
jgi:phosphoglycolate phosphatase-like HAD superfamily hydrolase